MKPDSEPHSNVYGDLLAHAYTTASLYLHF